MSELSAVVEEIARGLSGGQVIPFLGPEVLALDPANADVPSTPEDLVQRLTAKASVPHKIKNNLTAAAQFIENFKHRKTVVNLMAEAFQIDALPTDLHRFIAALNKLPLVVDVWYDNAMATALKSRDGWGCIQGLSQAEHFGTWTKNYLPDGNEADEAAVEDWSTVVYQPLGSISPTRNFLVSDSDYVEVLTEIDIQTPIPAVVQQRRTGRNFVFLGCRFANQLERSFARQTMKRSSDKHWAVLPEEPTKNEKRFLAEQNIQRVDVPLEEFVRAIIQVASEAGQAVAATA
ncbi:MAG: SIR2 family protein [Gammaproteobacteria bacterium]|jgi:hypothetical protein